MKEPNAMSFHVKYKPEDFMPANEEEKQSQVIMRESVGFWQDGFRRLRKNKVAMVSLFVIIVVMIFSFIMAIGIFMLLPMITRHRSKGARICTPCSILRKR